MFYWAYTYSVAVGVPVLLPRKEKARNEVAVPLLLTSPLGGYELSSRNMGLSPGVCGLVGISQTTAARDLFVYKNHNRVDVVGIMTVQRIPAAAKDVYPLENPPF